MAAHPALLSNDCFVFSLAVTSRPNFAASLISSYLLTLLAGVADSVELTSRNGDAGGLIVSRSTVISSSSAASCVRRSVNMTSFFSSTSDVFAVTPIC